MKKILLASFIIAASLISRSQSFSDDFESYNVGDALAATSDVWETWSSADGGADDTDVSATLAHSGNQSLYFASTSATGGPQDCVLPFPGELAVGQFNLEMWMYVNEGTGAYFNLQADENIGTTWAADVYFNSDGSCVFTSGGALNLDAFYPQGAWFKLRMENNLSTNTWEIFIDDVSQGSYANAQTQIASMDIYPVQGNQFYIDDVAYEYTDYTLPNLNGAVTNIIGITSALAGQSVTPTVQVRNLGTTAINSFDIEFNYNGTTINQSVTGVNIASLAFYSVALTDNITLAAGSNFATATISNVNGNSSDGDSNDDTKSVEVNPVVPAAGKKVIAEEGTGTWCPWCVRGAVYMEALSTQYEGYFVGIAVHNADPMTVDEYDAAMGGLISGYPSGLVDRGPEYDPSQFEVPFLERVQTAPKAWIENGATWDSGTRELKVSATTDWQMAANGNYKIALVLTEDGVTGTGSQWAQANAYAGGGNGPMGGYEDLPSPVPASQMVYDHVARLISPSFDGLPNAFASMINAGDVFTHNWIFTLPADWDETNIHIVAMVIAPDGTIDNASSSTIEEAVANGFVNGEGVNAISVLPAPDSIFQMYPNPATDAAYINVKVQNPTPLQIEIYSADGKLMESKNYGNQVGAQILTIPMNTWAAGLYTIKLYANDTVYTKQLVKE